MAISNPSTRLRMARSMPHWVLAQQQKETEHQHQRRPPTPPKVPPPSLSGDCGDPDYEIIEFPTRPQPHKSSTPRTNFYKCALCGTENVFARCDVCNANYCEACDDMNHKHPKRRNHVRRRIVTELATKSRPPLPPKGENVSSPPPIPPPRRNRKNAAQADHAFTLGTRVPQGDPQPVRRFHASGFHRDQRKPSCQGREPHFLTHRRPARFRVSRFARDSGTDLRGCSV